MANDPSSSTSVTRNDSGTPLIGVVGTCGSGKSTLIAGLERHGYRCRHIAQEHSYVKHMWQVITKPDILIFLESSFENSTSRRKLNWAQSDHEEQQRRLSHARMHAQLIVDTNAMGVQAVLARVLDFLEKEGPRNTPPDDKPTHTPSTGV